MTRRASARVTARLGARVIDASWRTPSRCPTSGAVPSVSGTASSSGKGFFTKTRLPRPIGEHAGACEVYTAAHRDLASKIAVPLGLGAGVFGSLVGVGGGVLIVPAMTAIVPIPQRVITGTSLIAVLATASVSSVNFFSQDKINFEAAVVLGAAATVFAPLGARATARLDGKSLKRALAYFLLVAAPLVPMKALAFEKRTAAVRQDDAAHGDVPRIFSLSLIGACAGFASGLLGIGGGTLMTPLLALTTPLPQATVLGTSLVAMLVPSAAAAAQHAKMGNVDLRIGFFLALGCAVGGFCGSYVAVDKNVPKGALEMAFFLGMLFLSHRTFNALAPKSGLLTKAK